MRMRRLLAFALAVTMLMGNTVTASATSASPIIANETVNTETGGDVEETTASVEETTEEDSTTVVLAT